MRPNIWLSRPALAGTLLGALALVAALWPSPAAAQAPDAQTAAGLPMPAPAGTTWTVLSGYNTLSHSGADPYALDLIRVDGDGAGTPILAPVDGLIAHRSSDCLAIRDEHANYILLCHILPDPGLNPGAHVYSGDHLGILKPPGPTEFWQAHLHLAVHRQLLTSVMHDTLPFSGPYALEGRDLPATTVTNAYRGLSFVSDNGAGELSLTSITLPAGLTHLTWVNASVPPAQLFAGLQDVLNAVYAWNPSTRVYRIYRPAAPAILSSMELVQAGDLLWVSLRSPFIWTRSPDLFAAAAP